jgi:hypothetical protein
MINVPHFANPVMSLVEAKAVLKPYYATVRQCIDDGWRQWMEYPLQHTMDSRARACFVNSAIVYNAKKALHAEDDVKIETGGNTTFFVIGAELKTRFKMLHGKKLTYSNYPTMRQMLLLTQQYNIPGILPGTYLTIGWTLDSLKQNITRHLITLQAGDSPYYTIDLDKELVSALPAIAAMPAIQPSTETAKPRRVRPRQQPTGKEKPQTKAKSAGQQE